MKLRTILTAIAGALLFAGSAYARQDLECPSLGAIKTEGFTMAVEFSAGFYYAFNLSNYGSDNNWGFLIAPVEGGSQNEAIEMANEILSSMTAEGVPHDLEGCEYDTANPWVIAVAVKDPNLIKLKNFYYSIR